MSKEWYFDYKKSIEELFAMGQPNAKSTIYYSPSKRYKIRQIQYSFDHTPKKGMMLEIYNVSDVELITTLYIETGKSSFCWAEEHEDGHDYLLITENPFVPTVIQCNTAKIKNFILPKAKTGQSFSWDLFDVSESSNKLAVIGNVYGCSPEVRIFDFTNPLKLSMNCQITFPYDYDLFLGWDDQSEYSLLFEKSTECRKSDRIPRSELSLKDKIDLEKDPENNIIFRIDTIAVKLLDESVLSKEIVSTVWKDLKDKSSAKN